MWLFTHVIQGNMPAPHYHGHLHRISEVRLKSYPPEHVHV